LTSNDIVVHARDLSKVYRLYAQPRYRVLDMIGLLRGVPGRHFSEHVALDGLNFQVRRGEKVGIIGRNGAGKSTLLKLITQVIRPTRGTLEVFAETQALLQIGSGFHPEFTGRENVRAYLAHLGLSRAEAERAIEEVVDFAELEEYIDQPVKAYSTGMAMRLMFSAATVMRPSLLVIDEVLGVGDAYFANKSFARIQAMCESRETTLLLVTHDIYGAAKLCDRMMWIEHGRIIVDDSPNTVVRLYEESVRDQEETRLRQRRLNVQDHAAAPASRLIGHLAPVETGRFLGDVFLRRLSLRAGDRVLAEWCEGTAGSMLLVVDDRESNWAAENETLGGAVCRRLRPHGSTFQKGVFLATPSGGLSSMDTEALSCDVVVASTHPLELEIAVFDPEGRRYLGKITVDTQNENEWKLDRAEMVRCDKKSVESSGKSIFGCGAIRITNVTFFDNLNQETQVYNLGEPFRIVLDYRILERNFEEKPVFILTFQRDGIVTHRLWCDALRLSYAERPEGRVEATICPNPMLAGDYIVTVSVYRERAWANGVPDVYFAINQDVLDFHAKSYELTIMDNHTSSRAGLLRGGLFQAVSFWFSDGQSVEIPIFSSSSL